MSKNQTFNVSLNLLTRNFNKGVKTIQTSLNNLKMQFRNFAAAMGAGLGISEIARSMVDSARKLDKAQTVLRNVSNGIENYADNQEFVMGLSRKYNQELTTLMGNYAKFYSAASHAGMALEEQKYIYESLTRAAAYYNLTAAETDGVMLAINQMISKGKVSSEELRRQLGERLPGAMQYAAEAMGTDVKGLDEMIRKGDVLATKLLPLLAEELNRVTKNLDVNTIEGATSKLKNTFTELTAKLNISKMYKNIINGISDGLIYVGNNLDKVKIAISTVLGTLASKPLIQKGVTSWQSFWNSLETQIDAQTKKVDRLRERANIIASSSGIRIDQDTLQPMVRPVDPRALKDYERLKFIADDYAAGTKELNVLLDQQNNKFSTMGKKIASTAKSFAKMIGIQAIYYAIAAAISLIITKVVTWAREQKRLKNIVSDTTKEFEKMTKTLGVDDTDLIETQAQFNSTDDLEKKQKLIARINRLLGLQEDEAFNIKSNENDINAAIKRRLELLEDERKYQAALSLITEKRNKIEELKQKKKGLSEKQAGAKESNSGYFWKDVGKAIKEGKTNKEITKIDTEIGLLEEAIASLEKTIEDEGLSTNAESRQIELGIVTPPDKKPDPNPNADVIKEYEEIQDEYNKELRTLNEMKKNQLMTEEEYNKALEELTLKTAESILALNDIDENTDAFAKSILDAAKAYIANVEKEDKVKDAIDKYRESVNELKQQYRNGLITSKELSDGMFELLEEVVMTVGGMKKLSGAAADLAMMFKQQSRRRVFDAIGKEEAPKLGEFDTTLNYKKDNSEIYAENADYIKDYADELKSYIDTLKEYKDELTGKDLETLNTQIDELETHLGTLTTKAESFSQAAKFAEVQEDIKNMKKELRAGIWDNISGIATAAERLTNSFKSLREIWKDPEVDGWEKFINIFTTIMSIVETCISVVKTFQAAMAIAEGLSLATAAAEQAGIPTKIQDAIATKAQATAAKELAVARHMATAAAVPYPGNIAAIASTAGALAAAFAAIPAFAEGGIVGGNSKTGDKILARLNSGELILNTGQQNTLWSLLNSKNNSGGNVTFELRGDKLIGVIENTKKKRSK